CSRAGWIIVNDDDLRNGVQLLLGKQAGDGRAQQRRPPEGRDDDTDVDRAHGQLPFIVLCSARAARRPRSGRSLQCSPLAPVKGGLDAASSAFDYSSKTHLSSLAGEAPGARLVPKLNETNHYAAAGSATHHLLPL